MDPGLEWTGDGALRQQLAQWTKQRGNSPRLYPGSLVWCFKKPGRELREKVELWLAWKRVEEEIARGTLGGDYDRADQQEVREKVRVAEDTAREEVWAGYRFVVIADPQSPDGLKVIDLGAGHSSSQETLCGRVIGALKSQGLLNESVGAGYLERNWPPAFRESGAWPLSSLRQSFLNGSLTRLVDPDARLRQKICEFVEHGDFGLASGPNPDGTYQRFWYKESISEDEVAFEPGVFLVLRAKAELLKAGRPQIGPEPTPPQPVTETRSSPGGGTPTSTLLPPTSEPALKALRIRGKVPPEVWNRLGTKLIPKLRSAQDVEVSVDFSVKVQGAAAEGLKADLRQIVQDLGLSGQLQIQEET
jgi:hypothetical protein